MELIELNADIRTTTGNGPARRLRCEGKMPAILYGPTTDPLMLSVGIKDVETILKNSKGSQVLLNLVIQDAEKTTRSAMIRELQAHPVSQKFLHADFYEIARNRKIRVRVPVVTKGISKGVEFGGMLQIIRRELEVLCFPQDVPETIEIDVADLDMGESVHVKDISLEGDIEIPAEVNFTVVTILSPKGTGAEEEEAEGGEEEGEEAAEPEAS